MFPNAQRKRELVLKPALNNMALTAVSGLIRSVPTVVHRVTLPPERDTLIRPAAKLLVTQTNIQMKNEISDSPIKIQLGQAFANTYSTGKNRTEGEMADLTRSAVREAGLIVSSQVEICGTGTFVFSAGGQKTQVAASPVCDLTLVLGYCTEGQKYTAEFKPCNGNHFPLKTVTAG